MSFMLHSSHPGEHTCRACLASAALQFSADCQNTLETDAQFALTFQVRQACRRCGPFIGFCGICLLPWPSHLVARHAATLLPPHMH